MVTNIPAPYRNPVYQRLAEKFGYDNFHVVFCARKEGNREWVIELQGFAHTFLNENSAEWQGRYIHNNPEVIGALRRLKPDVVVTSGFNPTHLYAFGYAMLSGKIHLPMTDGTLVSERKLSTVHRVIRRVVYRFSRAFVGASRGSARLYADYGIKPELFFQSHLCANNLAFVPYLSLQRQFDFMFCGRFAAEKNPIFALDVAAGVARELGRKVSILLVGSGPLLEEVRSYAATLADVVETTFPGFVQQADLPRLYCSAKVFLFPSSWDPWGVVANEACAAGQAVMVTPLAGVADDLIVDNSNGFVLPLTLSLWVERGALLLRDELLLEQFSASSRLRVQKYNYDEAAQGLVNAVLVAAGQTPAKAQQQVIPKKRRVVIVQRRMTHYRVPLFELLRGKLNQSGIELVVVYGDPTKKEKMKDDCGSLSWGKYQPCHYLGDGILCWQNLAKPIRDADLVIVTQENKLIYNVLMLFGKRNYKLAFWGHGANLQARNRDNLLERWKKWSSTKVDWWFAYSGLTVRLVEQYGFARERITNLENAIDTRTLRADVEMVTGDDVLALRTRLGIGNGPVGLYLGSLYLEKRIDFLLNAAQRIVETIPDFHLLVIGDGPLKSQVAEAAGRHPWVHYLGSIKGADKAIYLRLADIFLNPGMVGLSILDAFASGAVFVTTDVCNHSPEIDYLVNGENGLITADNFDAYVAEVVDLLNNPERLTRLRDGAKQTAEHYSIENMAENFHVGILQALGQQCVS